MSKGKQINYDSPEAAQLKTITGWVSSDGRSWGNGKNGEDMARYAGCTHRKCSKEGCNNLTEKSWTACRWCRVKSERERFFAKPFVEYNPEMVTYLDSYDKYFFNDTDIEEFIEETWDDDPEFDRSQIFNLIICEPIPLRFLDIDYFADDMHEDWEPSKELQRKIDALNEQIKAELPQSWKPGKTRTTYSTKH